MRHLVLLILMLPLLACMPVSVLTPEASSLPVIDAAEPGIILEFEGNDGAAFGQQGSVRLTSGGRLTCSLTTSVPFDGDVPRPPLVFELVVGDLFLPLATIIRENGVPGPPPAGPNVAGLVLPDETIHIPPGPAFDGFASDIAVELLGLLGSATRWQCLPFG